MIYTVTFNPAIDYVMHPVAFLPGQVNRSAAEEMYFGGKGINVSAVLHELGVDSCALGFVAGLTGDAIEKGVAEMGIRTDFIRLPAGMSRINVKIKGSIETELNGKGPDIAQAQLDELFSRLDRLEDGDTLVLAGSITGSLPADTYENILARLSHKDIMTVADAEKQLLLNVLKYRPYLIKPNNFELVDMFGTELKTDADIVEYAGKLQKMGARNVLVSMAEKGALLLCEDGTVHRCGVCRGEVKNSVGAGDSMLAGFIAGCSGGDFGYALRLGTACGGATAFSDGLAKREDIFALLGQLTEEVQ